MTGGLRTLLDQLRRRRSKIKKMEEMDKQSLEKCNPKKEDQCSRILYGVAEIRGRGEQSEEGREAKHWIYGRTRLKIIIYSWGVVEKVGGGR